MFYTTDLLKASNGRLATVWLAATLTGGKKLAKKEVLSVDIQETCDYIKDPEEPLALRLSSNLLFGVSKVYAHQYQFFYGKKVWKDC